MPQHPFPDPGPDGEEPDSSLLPPEAEGTGPENDRVEPAAQGLYVCLPAEQLTLAGFAQGGEADTMTPGPLLATIVDTVTGQDGTGLAGCSDDQLMGIISAARRIESRTAWTLMAAIAEFAARHDGSKLDDEFALQHLIRARSATCTAPGCRRPAARCDLDHTVPWDQGGITCECDLAPRLSRDRADLEAAAVTGIQLSCIGLPLTARAVPCCAVLPGPGADRCRAPGPSGPGGR
jgi:hypothetical protein